MSWRRSKPHCDELGVPAAVSEVVARGGEGGAELAEAVLAGLDEAEPVPAAL